MMKKSTFGAILAFLFASAILARFVCSAYLKTVTEYKSLY